MLVGMQSVTKSLRELIDNQNVIFPVLMCLIWDRWEWAMRRVRVLVCKQYKQRAVLIYIFIIFLIVGSSLSLSLQHMPLY